MFTYCRLCSIRVDTRVSVKPFLCLRHFFLPQRVDARGSRRSLLSTEKAGNPLPCRDQKTRWAAAAPSQRGEPAKATAPRDLAAAPIMCVVVRFSREKRRPQRDAPLLLLHASARRGEEKGRGSRRPRNQTGELARSRCPGCDPRAETSPSDAQQAFEHCRASRAGSVDNESGVGAPWRRSTRHHVRPCAAPQPGRYRTGR
jgi:hypothetical protein